MVVVVVVVVSYRSWAPTWSTMVRSPFLAKAGIALEIVVALSEYEMAYSVPMNSATSSSICRATPQTQRNDNAPQTKRETTQQQNKKS